VALVFALVGAGCTEKRTDPNRPLEVLVSQAPETLDPRYATDAVGLRTTRLVHAGLFGLEAETLAPVPLLAESYRFEGPLELHVKLRENVRFHGGKALDSADVVATLRAFVNPKVASRHAKVLETIASVDAEGPHGVKIVLAKPHATLLTDLEIPILRADQAASAPAPDGTLDGLGPFRVARIGEGVVELVPDDTRAVPMPKHAVTLRAVRDENARALRLHAGSADIVQNGFSPVLLPSFSDVRAGTGLTVVTRPGVSLTYVLPRCDRGVMQDVRVRRAVSLAMDRELVARTLFAGHAKPAGTLLPEGHWARPRIAEAEKRDLAKARALVAEANAQGAHVSLLVSTDRSRKVLARVLAAELEEAGFVVEIVPLELGTMLARLGAGDFELAMLQLPELIEPNVLRTFLHGELVPPRGSNRGRVRDANLDALLDEGDATLDVDARTVAYAKLEALIRFNAYVLPLVHEDHVAVVSERARAYVPNRDGRFGNLVSLP